MSKETGGSAFPETQTRWNPDNEENETVTLGGMTLRDYFAAQSLASFPPQLLCTAESKAHWAYQVADAMLKERAK